ncbi:MAG: class I SAM-dependent methyltransferase [Verrucomicrobiia bacterium]
MTCKICGKESKLVFRAKILKKYEISYFHCEYCGFLQTEEPYWLGEVYKSPINISDTGYLSRNIGLSKIVTPLLILFFDYKKSFLDYAGGYGVFVRLMRDIGFDFYWSDKYTQNLFARGFEYVSGMPIEAITTFESFEHFDKPMKEIENMLKISKNIIFSTELLPASIPEPEQWWYYGLDHGQHISFYSKKTLNYIASYFGLKYFSLGNIHILTEKENISNLKLKVLKLNKFGLHKYLSKFYLTSKTWEDYLKVSNENTI